MQMRDIKPFALRMPAAMRLQLERLAKQNRRSLNQEIVEKLEKLLSDQPYEAPKTTVVSVREPSAPYRLNEVEVALLEILKAMPIEKQLAMLSLFK